MKTPHFAITHKGAGFQITFKNGYTISVQFGTMHYCEHHNSFDFEAHRKAFQQHKPWTSPNAEIAILDPDGNWATKQFVLDANDDVVGYVEPDSVGALIADILAIPAKIP